MNLSLSIFPALLGFLSTSIILFYFFKNNSSLGIIISSFTFILSGFIFEFNYKNYHYIKKIVLESNQVLNIPILTTIIGIFLGNRLLKLFADNEERKKQSILLINNIDSQIRSLQLIDNYLTDNFREISHYSKYIKIYKNRISCNNIHQKISSNLGIFDQDTIDIISQYLYKLEEHISYLDKFLLDIDDNDIQRVEIKYYNCRANNIILVIFGCLCLYTLKVKYIEKNKEETIHNFLNDYQEIGIKKLQYFFNENLLCLVDENSANYIIKNLKNISKNFLKINRAFINNTLVDVNINFYLIQFFRAKNYTNMRLAQSEEQLNYLLQEEKERWNNIKHPEIITISLK